MAAGGRTAEELNAAVLEQLECPVCYNYCVPPILMCPNGHSVCNKCVDRLFECPVCKAPKPSIRNLFAEEMSTKVIVNCKNFENGCDKLFNLVDFELHLQKCPYSTKCRIRVSSDGNLKCQWTGTSKEGLIQHVRKSHPGHIYEGNVVQINCLLNIQTSRIVDVRMLLTKGEVFWVFLHYEAKTESLYPYVRYDGPDELASSYECVFDFLACPNERNVVFRGQCICLNDLTSLLDDISLPLHKNLLGYFISDRELQFKVAISKH